MPEDENASIMTMVKTMARHLLQGLGGAASAAAAYLVVAVFAFFLFFSLLLLPILLLYTPFAILIIGLAGVVVSFARRPPSSGFVAFWSGWALCPAVYLVIVLTK
ncbi:hypothetical protein ACWCOT_22610 [Nonomuraea bangladeshensis]|uniref:hypothetical protein n=1 Tax=Nonomuraea bangladeshensis TaxID=404385 RepID=UPI003C2C9BAF